MKVKEELVEATEDLQLENHDNLKSELGKKKSKRLFKEVIELIVTLVIVYLIFTFVLISVHVKGPSMQPNYFTGDRAIALRVNRFNRPNYEDVIIVQVGEDLLIKRLYGKPNDKIEIKNNKVFINDEAIMSEHDSYVYEMQDLGPIVLGEDEYFVLGDNRDDSKDSRAFGPVKESDLIGVHGIKYWPLGAIGLLN